MLINHSVHCLCIILFVLIATNKKLRMLCISRVKAQHSHRKTSTCIEDEMGFVYHSKLLKRPYETDIEHNYFLLLPLSLSGKNCKELERKNLNA